MAKGRMSRGSKSAKSMMKTCGDMMSSKTLTYVLLAVIILLLLYTFMNKHSEGFTVQVEPEGVSANFVMFYADWCPHCVSTKPEVEKLENKLNNMNNKVNNKKVNVTLVDCEKHEDLARKYEVNGFPTIALFKEDGNRVEYESGRDAESMMEFLQENV